MPHSSQYSPIRADLDVEFAGETAHYKDVEFQFIEQGSVAKISGAIPSKLTDFKIDPPSLLTVPIKNDIPVKVEMTWRKL